MKRNWTSEEDATLVDLIAQHGKHWGMISGHLPNRTASQVASRWEKCLDPSIHKGPFTLEEDQLLVNYVVQFGAQNWPRVTSFLPNRSAKQCRERWFNHLSPSIVKSEWSQQEDELIFQQFTLHGPKWSKIAKVVPGRSDNAIKNRWNSSVSRRIETTEDGRQIVLPDSSKRKYRPKPRPSPLVIPLEAPQGRKGLPPPLFIPCSIGSPSGSPTTPLTPLCLVTAVSEQTLLSPTFTVPLTPVAFGDLASPRDSFILSLTRPDVDETFK
jgi:hypothetical protein